MERLSGLLVTADFRNTVPEIRCARAAVLKKAPESAFVLM